MILLFISLFLFILPLPIYSIGYGFSINHFGGSNSEKGAICNYISKYNIALNLR
jgi:hypothetical protein